MTDRIAELERLLAESKADERRTWAALIRESDRAEDLELELKHEKQTHVGLLAAIACFAAERGRTAEKFRRLRERVRAVEAARKREMDASIAAIQACEERSREIVGTLLTGGASAGWVKP